MRCFAFVVVCSFFDWRTESGRTRYGILLYHIIRHLVVVSYYQCLHFLTIGYTRCTLLLFAALQLYCACAGCRSHEAIFVLSSTTFPVNSRPEKKYARSLHLAPLQ